MNILFSPEYISSAFLAVDTVCYAMFKSLFAVSDLSFLCLSFLEMIASVIIDPGGICPSWSGSLCDGVPGFRWVVVWGAVSEDSHHPPV